jgi:uncharacterized membrane protein YoaK (UPF0700 family)
MLLMLTWAAGSVDAISYLGLGHVFTAMMTGNTVLLGLALAEGEFLAVLRSILALAGFLAGAAVGALIVERDEKQEEWPPTVTRALALEGVVLGTFDAIWYVTLPARGAGVVQVLIVLSGLAMGVQAAAVRHLGVPGIATTYITGTITSLVVDLVGWLRSFALPPPATTSAGGAAAVPAPNWERRVGLLAGVFSVYGLGALAAALLQARWSALATLSPFVAVALVVANASVRHRHRPALEPPK